VSCHIVFYYITVTGSFVGQFL